MSERIETTLSTDADRGSEPRRAVPRVEAPQSHAREVEAIVGAALAEEVEEYFEHGARVARGDVVVDVGANIGAFAAAVAARTGGDVTLHCFEPAGPLFTRLEANFRRTPLLARTRHELHALALCAPEQHGQSRPFYYFSRFPTDSTYDLERKLDGFRDFFRRAGRTMEGEPGDGLLQRALGRVASRTLHRLCREDSRLGVWLTKHITGMRELRCELASLEQVIAARGMRRVDLLKIDVEGAELDVLRGCEGAWPLIQRVVIETDRRQGRDRTISDLLVRHGLRITSSRPPRVAAEGDRELVVICAERA